MFERRLKIFLAVLSLMIVVLAARAAQIQLVERSKWNDRADKFLVRPDLLETTRGRILDLKGRVIAEDQPCIDAMVEYPAIVHDPDKKWLLDQAASRLKRRLGDDFSKAPLATRQAMVKAEFVQVNKDLAEMWSTLAHCPGMDEEKMEQVRQEIIRKVEYRQRWNWLRGYDKALKEQKGQKPWYSRWLSGDDKSLDMDQFQVTVSDEVVPHPVLLAIDQNTITVLGKNLGRYPGLSLQPGTHRYYPYQETGCHFIGSLAPVDKQDITDDPDAGDELRRYLPTDLIGRSGLESYAEPVLRGSRGLTERALGTHQVKNHIDPIPGRDIRSSVDIELQQEIQDIFPHVTVGQQVCTFHGAAVVIDVPTGQVRALASYPTFNPNERGDKFAEWAADRLDAPLMDRATQSMLEPGSTVKPMVGLWGMKTGVLGINETIECTGYLIINGQRMPYGKCWTAGKRILEDEKNRGLTPMPGHHQVPYKHPTGFLTFADALERSCNVFHETVSLRLGIDRLSEGFSAFGLGQPSGIGIAESRGRLPNTCRAADRGANSASCGIGQGWIAATPIQMAGVAATIARDGVWLRPQLLADDLPDTQLRPAARTNRPSQVNLHLPPEGLAMAKLGMWNVVHSPSGTGNKLNFEEVGVCGKTGTAQAAVLLHPKLDENMQKIPLRDADGNALKDANGNIRWEMEPLEPSTPEHPNPEAPWYIGAGYHNSEISHAWYMGFAPREHPQIAFCVLIEYGGSGGVTAAAVAHQVLAACVEHGYLAPEKQRP